MKKSVISLCFFLFVLLTGCGESVEYQPDNQQFLPSESTETLVETTDETVQNDIYVSILGEVINPGVYIVTSGSRMFEAINLAGGITTEADLTGINLVDFVEDGMQITIPKANEYSYVNDNNSPVLTNHDGLVNINTADVEALKTIPGIGDTRAAAIIEYREKNGKFKSIEDIMNVSGIKNNTFDSIKNYIYAE